MFVFATSLIFMKGILTVNIRIRKLKAEDAEDISKIYNSIIQKPVDADFNSLIKKHAQRKEDACFVAEIHGKVAGFMISYIVTLGFGVEKSAWIATLGVDPKYWGMGIGKSMAEEVFKRYQAQGITDVYTSVQWNSPDILSFFKTLDFHRSNFINLCKTLKKE